MNIFKILAMILVVEIILVVFLMDRAHQRENNMTEPRFIKTNQLGCSQYVFKGDVFWKCPKELQITGIEQSNSKTTEIQPVFSEK